MSKSNATEADLMALIFNATALPWAAASIFYLAYHTADPGEAGDQTTNEANYTGYARVAITRNSSGFTVSGNQASNTALMNFPECTGGTNTLTHISIGLNASGASQILYKGALTAPLSISNLITPNFPVGTLIVQED